MWKQNHDDKLEQDGTVLREQYWHRLCLQQPQGAGKKALMKIENLYWNIKEVYSGRYGKP